MPHKISLEFDEQGRCVAQAVSDQSFFSFAQALIFPDWEHTSAFLQAYSYQKTHPNWAGVPHAFCGEYEAEAL